MISMIESRVRVDVGGAVVFRDARLIPGEEVEIVLRPVSPKSAGRSFLETAQCLHIDAPSNFSLQFDESVRIEPAA